jgi:hypothetical protein
MSRSILPRTQTALPDTHLRLMQPLQLGTMHVITRMVAEPAKRRALSHLRALVHGNRLRLHIHLLLLLLLLLWGRRLFLRRGVVVRRGLCGEESESWVSFLVFKLAR